jgi:hypothetical protein
MTKEQKGLAVLEWLIVGPQTFAQLMALTQMRRAAVRQGIDWLRDFDPNCLIVQRNGTQHAYKLAEEADEVRGYIHGRSRTLYRMALRLERMVNNALASWPEDRVLDVMERHLRHMREDVEVLEKRSDES